MAAYCTASREWVRTCDEFVPDYHGATTPQAEPQPEQVVIPPTLAYRLWIGGPLPLVVLACLPMAIVLADVVGHSYTLDAVGAVIGCLILAAGSRIQQRVLAREHTRPEYAVMLRLLEPYMTIRVVPPLALPEPKERVPMGPGSTYLRRKAREGRP